MNDETLAKKNKNIWQSVQRQRGEGEGEEEKEKEKEINKIDNCKAFCATPRRNNEVIGIR